MASRTETDLHAAARECVLAAGAREKIDATRRTAAAWRDAAMPADVDRADHHCSEDPLSPGFPAAMQLVDPLSVKKRKLSTARGKKAFVHAIAHIEYNAVNLAWDCVYRYRGLPRAFYDDWVRVASEEAKHFALLNDRLEGLECSYGELPSHNGLWEMAERTRGDLTQRMALVPRFLEARGLDVTPAMIERLAKLDDGRTSDILRVIYEDEIGHVAIGSRWFRWSCERDGVDPDRTFEKILDENLRGRVKPPINQAARRLAGFNEDELRVVLDLAAAP